MDERKRHIVEDYPAERLPPELRGDIDPSHHARVIVEDTGSEVPARSGWRKHFRAAAHRNTSIEEAVARIRELRDEWEK
ncbi:hypothetical protein L0F51_14085 [Afifella sp. H1R]|uniref:hypothetical protein n=1 Tax=Afifella sp. H1R TaxID=2908841 RepID=UPI001F44776F|nr:hypothetical protein [Afifella sp. H1R]MCF1504878.1 hypothetical protein [Afifella sp. H1R]